ncbi:MAG: hypothetical protein P4L63_01220 [Candidatus Pacebacteria bacterium]|nr:hypothetical protein [Candidatus Paceibacterota bacterium]
MKNIKTVLVVLVLVALVLLGAYLIFFQNKTTTPPIAPTNPNSPVDTSIIYNNTIYGFTFSLPSDWKGYSIMKNTWNGQPQNNNTSAQTGPELLIRNPNWTATTHYEDIPIMVFTISQWNSYVAGNFATSAAPFPAAELGRNNIYVFAIPPRWDYDYSQGFQEADTIVTSKPLHPFDL